VNFSAELDDIAKGLRSCASQLAAESIGVPIKRLEAVSNEFAAAWCGSFFGYHVNIYYKDFRPPPAGDHFDIESGNKDIYGERFRADT
jgi:hypothetical protein